MASANVPLLNDDDDDTIQFGEEERIPSKKLKHPYVTFFHLFFRISAIVVYLFCGILYISYITSFVVVVLFLSMDFWTVKNISGRLLVGLRWWNYVDEDGKSHWVFEAKKANQQNRIDASEVKIFWSALILVPIVWSMLFIVSVFTFDFKWVLLVCIAIVLNGANLYAYMKCKIGANEPLSSSLTNLSSNFFKKQLIMNMATIISRPQESSQKPPSVI